MHRLINSLPIFISGYELIFSQKLKQLYRAYLSDNQLILTKVEYDVPSLTWPPPKAILNGYVMTSFMRGLS